MQAWPSDAANQAPNLRYPELVRLCVVASSNPLYKQRTVIRKPSLLKTKALVLSLNRVAAFLGIGLLPIACFAAASGNVIQQYQDPANQDSAHFGNAVAGYGSQPLVGAPATTGGGAVYMYDAGLTNVPTQTFHAPATLQPSSFGTAIATRNTEILISDPAALPLSGSGVVTTSPMESSPDNFRGAVFHYGSALDIAPQTIINPIVGTSSGFGSSLAIRSGGRFAVGDPFLTTQSLPQNGRVYVYNTISTSPTITLENPVPASQARFGRSIAFYGDETTPAAPDTETSYHGALAVGAPGVTAVFQFNPDTGDLLNIIETPASNSDGFGSAVTTADTRLIVGAPNASSGVLGNTGKVYIFDRFTGVLQRTLTDPSPISGRFFGYSLAMLDSTNLIVGSWAPAGGSGPVRVFNINTGVEVATLTSPNTKRPQFGSAVAAAGVNVLVGDPVGAADASTGLPGRAYLFGLNASPAEPPNAPSDLSAVPVNSTSIQLTFTDNSLNENGFTLERHLDGVATYSPLATLPPNSSGYTDMGLTPSTAYWYRIKAFNAAGQSPYSNETSATTRAETPPDLVGEIPNPGVSGDLFGFAIAKVGKSRLAIGAPGTDAGAVVDSGKVYIYTPPSLTPALTLTNPNPTAYDQFGYSVSAVGENILVGAPGTTTSTLSGGHAYLFSGVTGQVIFAYQNPGGLPGSQFGFSVAGYGKKLALIGAPGAGPLGTQSGNAHLFDAKKTGALIRTYANGTNGGNRFGQSVAAAKNIAAIVEGNVNNGGCPVGSIFFYSLKTGAGLGAINNAQVVTEANKRFLVGASTDCGSLNFAYLVKGFTSQLIYPPPAGLSTRFGSGVGGGKKFLAIGAPILEDAATQSSGVAYRYNYKSPTPLRTYINPSPDTGDQFGRAIAFPGKTFLAIGAPYDDTKAPDAGAAYLYTIPKK